MMRTIILLLLLAAASNPVPAADLQAPAVSHDGLVLQERTSSAYVYLRPGASLNPYNKVNLLDCTVAFHKDWQREQNMNATTNRQKVTANDMQRIRDALAAEFRTVFTEVLQKEGGYEIVQTPGDDVLLVKPAIIDLVLTMPAIRSPDAVRSTLTSAGGMTLYMELYDSATGALIARVIDPELSEDANFETQGARITNKKAADEILGKWARALSAHLGDIE
jgi:hypothetical protein